MTELRELSDAHVVLLAVQLASEGNLKDLQRLVRSRRHVLSNSLLYRLLLSFCPPEISEQSALVDFLTSLREFESDPSGDTDIKVDPSISQLSKQEAISQCQALRLRSVPEHATIDTDSTLANFIIEWAKGLELVNSATQPALHFVEQFIDQDADLRLWYETYLAPVVRLQYEYYPDIEDVIGLQGIETLSGPDGIRALLQYAEREHTPDAIVRDLDYVVTPWVRGSSRGKRRRVDRPQDIAAEENTSWEAVNQWLVALSMKDFDVAARSFAHWSGPVHDAGTADEVVARFAQTGLAIIYGCSETSPETQARSQEVLDKVSRLTGLKAPDLRSSQPDIALPPSSGKNFNEADLSANSLMQRDNPFTYVSQASMDFLVGLIHTAEILLQFRQTMPVADLARICVFGSELRHKEELRRLLQYIPRMTSKDIDWRSVRQQLLWLQSWGHSRQLNSDSPQPAFFGRLTRDYVETQILDALLKAGQYEIVKKVYMDTSFLPLKMPELEDRVVAAILEAYDNASNGNRDRGGMKRAYEILRAFQPRFPESSSLSSLDHLIRATHSLSFYHLTLQHGTPFKPVAIRVQKDPLTLVEKVLEQDANAYTKLDDLLEITRNLVRAHLPNAGAMSEEMDSVESGTLDAEHRITYSAIMAALAADDFHTAYAYITTRLSGPRAQSVASETTDDVSWRAAYAAGKYRPKTTPKGLKERIDSLVQRMELLSRALLLAPSGEALAGILATWRRYEEEMDALKAQAMEEERAFEAQADASLPGGYAPEGRDADVAETKRAMARRIGPGIATGPSYEEEAPLGLFDVARGAAAALRRSAALPLGSSGLQNIKIRETAGLPNTESEDSSSHAGGRVRKRDMVTNMVTSGLVSGMGWVLGAQPQDRVDEQ
ncbi:hypothetical protein ABEF92_003953 [Exophiala dermatitidis]|uniref:Sec39 domain-containing protein n=1 Tax=Exophiala dermatitidis (strain ATCC 34100 / CBS 525.76 / NIH/UT8656) TaxID=858893 RepID=H6BRC7_EXODN|nr:uncharacterized protein HMPREF1120_02873 [Exophiala dermatitidis NIH/UT8656]EHY54708.1 hypothetical protein HMPREF1120_02873 [Exophiala dermatitidis NIH/UT8656]